MKKWGNLWQGEGGHELIHGKTPTVKTYCRLTYFFVHISNTLEVLYKQP